MLHNIPLLLACMYISLFILIFHTVCTLTHWPVCALFLYVTQKLSPEQFPGKSLLMVRYPSGNSAYRQVSASEANYQHILHIAKLKGQTSPTAIATTR